MPVCANAAALILGTNTAKGGVNGSVSALSFYFIYAFHFNALSLRAVSFAPRLALTLIVNHPKKSRIDSTDKTGFSRLFLFFLFYAVVSIARGFFE